MKRCGSLSASYKAIRKRCRGRAGNTGAKFPAGKSGTYPELPATDFPSDVAAEMPTLRWRAAIGTRGC